MQDTNKPAMLGMPLRWLIVAVSVALGTLAIVGCLPITVDSRESEVPFTGAYSVDESAKEAAQSGGLAVAVKANTAFALDLYERLRGYEGNLFFAPYSISTALVMTSAGAKGATLEEMGRVLHLPSGEQYHPAQGALRRAITRHSRGVELVTSNALWAQKGRQLSPEFLTLCRGHYGAAVEQVDFQGDTETARKTINGWTARQTRDRIQDLLVHGVLNDRTRLVLTNAVYFKAKWANKFDKSATAENDFHLDNGQKLRAWFMKQTASFPYAQTNGVQVLELPYVGKELSLVILLPQRGRCAEMEAGLAKNLEGWLAKLQEREVAVTLPRFQVTGELSLKDTLAAMGMPTVFGESADLSGLLGSAGEQERLYLSAVVHKAFVDVNEDGTEAAASTAAVAGTLSAAMPSMPVEFTANRSFVYLIRDRQTGSLLFMGRMTKT